MNGYSYQEQLSSLREEFSSSPPADALASSEKIVLLTAILGNIHDAIGYWESLYIENYNEVIQRHEGMAAEKLKILAMNCEQYRELQRAKRASELCLEMIQGLKYRTRALAGEWRESGNQ